MSDDAEADRLGELAAYQVLDTPEEPQFDRIVELARVLFAAPCASISLIDRDRQWLKARAGMGAQEMSRQDSFCTHTIEGEDVFVVADAIIYRDPRGAEPQYPCAAGTAAGGGVSGADGGLPGFMV